MGTNITEQSRDAIERAVTELESIAEEIKLKLHLASMDAKTTWEDTLEPKLFEARVNAKEATDSSRRAVEDVVAALRNFSRSI